MSTGKHARRFLRSGRLSVVLLVLAGVSVLAGSSSLAAIRYDHSASSRILPGVSIAGVGVGGMTREEAVAAVGAKAELSLSSDLVVQAAGTAWHVTPAGLGMRADVEGAVDRAFAVADSMSLFSRVYHRVLGKPVDRSIDLGYAYDRSKIQAFVKQAYATVNKPAEDAGVSLVDGQVVAQRARVGRALKVDLSVAMIKGALAEHLQSVAMPVVPVQPAVTAGQLGYTIVIKISDNRLYLYHGLKVVKTYPVATAKPGFTTPIGTWKVINKVENPTWVNPAPNGWGAGEPAVIPPGPGNPLGTRALYLSAPGIRIHGTYDSPSVGTYASHGCIRMYIADSEALYPLIPIGTKVLIVP